MLEEAEVSNKGHNGTTLDKNFFEDISSLEEADCYLDFLSQPYPHTGK
ncbi:hypothetical protein X975_08326, partial [Stegodyphus mimosarum]